MGIVRNGLPSTFVMSKLPIDWFNCKTPSALKLKFIDFLSRICIESLYTYHKSPCIFRLCRFIVNQTSVIHPLNTSFTIVYPRSA